MLPPRTISRSPFLYALSLLFFVLALAGVAALIGSDIFHGFNVSVLHQRLDAWPLIMIGLSYITLQLAAGHKGADRIKGIFLGVAFLLWGAEQLFPPSRLVTFMDEGAVTIFVVDVSLIIWSHLNRHDVTQLP